MNTAIAHKNEKIPINTFPKVMLSSNKNIVSPFIRIWPNRKALPLYDVRSREQHHQSSSYSTPLLSDNLACPEGFEPSTGTLEECCSSAELRAQISQMLMMGVLIINIFVFAFSIYSLSGTPAQFIGIE